MQKLTKKQELFCNAYLANGFNGTQAAIHAGYSEDSAKEIASENLTKPNIKEFLDKRMKKVEEKLEITAEWKMQKLKQCIELAMPEAEGKIVLANHKALLGAIVELNKMQGHYAAERTFNTTVTVDADLETAKELTQKYRREL